MERYDLQQVIDNPRYHVRELHHAITEMPNQYSFLDRLGLFHEEGIRSDFVEIEREKEILNILPTTTDDAPATKARSTTADKRVLKLLNIEHEDAIYARAFRNMPAFGTEDFFDSLDIELAKKMLRMSRKFEQTFEWHKWQALRGKVYDADGTTLLYDVFAEMGETQKSIDFKFNTTDSDTPLAAAREARRYMEKNLRGEFMTGMLVVASSGFMDKLTGHPEIRDIYKESGRQVYPNPVFDDVYNGFTHGSVTYIEHNGTASWVNPVTGQTAEHDFIPEGEAIMIPLGTMETFVGYFGPGSTFDTVDQIGQKYFPNMRVSEDNKRLEIGMQSCPLFFNLKPRLVLRGYSSN